MYGCWVRYKFGVEFGIIELVIGILYIIINVLNDYCASFISFCYDEVIPVLNLSSKSISPFGRLLRVCGLLLVVVVVEFISTCLHLDMSTSGHVDMWTCGHVYMSTCLHVYMSTCWHVGMWACVHVYMSTCPHAHM